MNKLVKHHNRFRAACLRLLIAAAAMLFVVNLETPLHAQQAIGGGIPGFAGFRPRVAGFSGGFGGYTTLFDLYRTGQIPLPPYYALHPPVYYGQREYQTYGRTPFAFPYTWWQQNMYGSPGLGAPLAPGAGRPISISRKPVVVTNPYLDGDVASTSANRYEINLQPNPHLETLSAAASRIMQNPFYKPAPTEVAAAQ